MTHPNDPHAVDLLAVARTAQQADLAAFRGPDAIKLMAPAKVNLFLDIGPRRADGYHEAISIMHALLLHDVLYMKLAPAGAGLGAREGSGAAGAASLEGSFDCGLAASAQDDNPGVAFAQDDGPRTGATLPAIELACVSAPGIAPLDVDPAGNIVTRAIRLLARTIGRDVPETVVVRLEKHIPAQAGLGGGSSAAAAALVGAAHLWGLAPDDPRIEEAARSLGADVAFFLHGGCACFEGVGDAFTHELAPMGKSVALVKPDGGVSTAQAYRTFDEHPHAIDPDDRAAALAARAAQDVPLRNNLVPASEQLLPALVEVRTWLEAQGGVQQVLMSGSGSAVFAVCESFGAAGSVTAQAQARGWWARATTFGPARAAVIPRR